MADRTEGDVGVEEARPQCTRSDRCAAIGAGRGSVGVVEIWASPRRRGIIGGRVRTTWVRRSSGRRWCCSWRSGKHSSESGGLTRRRRQVRGLARRGKAGHRRGGRHEVSGGVAGDRKLGLGFIIVIPFSVSVFMSDSDTKMCSDVKNSMKRTDADIRGWTRGRTLD
ncbi:putative proline-rich receptor-like protein kinase PERK8 [Iris pallida]|uniref:Proline-rich receptor-like protein kinase PERK8 n=1 Tax=Iris pallida TaxID=29817 RepID=A0AAX6I4Y6_IRIPA|nr:putative proline-rich receptor-like protein kinase PERK8 [Iris pallida]